MSGPPPKYAVLVVEDDPNHALLIRTVFRHARPEARLHLVGRAEEAITYLRPPGSGPDVEASLPDVVVLDVNMPGIGGLGFLRWYGGQESPVADIPVIVFTSSDDPELARRCFSLGAREFKDKPADFRELIELVERVLDKWRPSWRQDRTA